MEDKEKAMALLESYMFSSIYFTQGLDGAKLNAKTCAKLDLQHSIELLSDLISLLETDKFATFLVEPQLQSLRNQLEHLNSI